MNTELGANYRFSNGFFTCLMLHSVACGLDTSHLLLEARVKCYAFSVGFQVLRLALL